jgi:circadian clock protein KaiC
MEPPAAHPDGGGRISFGIAGLDEMLHGGLVARGATAILGVPGSGKTLLALKFLEQGLAGGERALFFGFNESPDRLLKKAAAIGIDMQPWADKGALQFLWQPPLEYALDELAWRLLKSVEERRPKRVVIDGMKGFLNAASERTSLSMFLTALTGRLRALDVDALVTEELPFLGGGRQEPPDLVAPIIENVLMVRHVELRGVTRRFISVLKVRESGYDNAVKELVITDGGIRVAAASRSAIGALDERSG